MTSFFNPTWLLDRFRQEQNRQDFLGTLELSADPTSWLNLLGRVGKPAKLQYDLFKNITQTYDRTFGRSTEIQRLRMVMFHEVLQTRLYQKKNQFRLP